MEHDPEETSEAAAEVVKDMEENLWQTFQQRDGGGHREGGRRHWWKINNKPSWELPHPGMMAAQWVSGNQYWCRCVRTPSGEIVAVREGGISPG